MANFWLFTTGFLPLQCRGQVFSLQRRKFSRVDALWRAYSADPPAWEKALVGSVQGAEPLVNQGEERFERISRAKFNVDTPDAGRQPGCNFKESQTNLADRGNFEFGAP